MNSMRIAAATAATLTALALTGCGAVQQAAEDAAASAVDSVAQTAKLEALKQLCSPVTDGTLNASDLQLLSGLVEPAQAAGVSAEILEPLKELAAAGDSAPQAAIDAAKASCEDGIAKLGG